MSCGLGGMTNPSAAGYGGTGFGGERSEGIWSGNNTGGNISRGYGKSGDTLGKFLPGRYNSGPVSLSPNFTGSGQYGSWGNQPGGVGGSENIPLSQYRPGPGGGHDARYPLLPAAGSKKPQAEPSVKHSKYSG